MKKGKVGPFSRKRTMRAIPGSQVGMGKGSKKEHRNKGNARDCFTRDSGGEELGRKITKDDNGLLLGSSE